MDNIQKYDGVDGLQRPLLPLFGDEQSFARDLGVCPAHPWGKSLIPRTAGILPEAGTISEKLMDKK